MKEILFRGKRIDNGKWIEGCLLKVTLSGKTAYLIFGDEFGFAGTEVEALCHALVGPETIGQYTGVTDKNDRKIFEGDIVRVHDYLAKRGDPWHEFEGVVGHQNASFVIISDVVKHYRWIDYECEIIGNIHDNPEMMEAEE